MPVVGRITAKFDADTKDLDASLKNIEGAVTGTSATVTAGFSKMEGSLAKSTAAIQAAGTQTTAAVEKLSFGARLEGGIQALGRITGAIDGFRQSMGDAGEKADDLRDRLAATFGDLAETGVGRQVPLNPMAAQIAKFWREQGGDFLFPDNSKNRLHAGSAWTRYKFSCALRAAGISGMTWHDLRHTFATRALQGGARPEQISRMLGHTNLSMTSRYLHWAPDQLWPAAMAGFNRPANREANQGTTWRPEAAPSLPVLAGTNWALPVCR